MVADWTIYDTAVQSSICSYNFVFIQNLIHFIFGFPNNSHRVCPLSSLALEIMHIHASCWGLFFFDEGTYHLLIPYNDKSSLSKMICFHGQQYSFLVILRRHKKNDDKLNIMTNIINLLTNLLKF